jgi:predicted nuclease with TOPRIM domain
MKELDSNHDKEPLREELRRLRKENKKLASQKDKLKAKYDKAQKDLKKKTFGK